MAAEIELKAHAGDVEAIKRLLFDKDEFLWTFEKEDSYWFNETNPSANCRLRREKLILADGSEKSSCLVTYKNKQKRDGIEVNDEKEFEVCPKNGRAEQVFGEFLARVGLKPGVCKKKRGWAFNREGINAELCEVEGLGWFIELEIIINNTDEAEDYYDESRKRLLDFLDSLGIKREAIESRFYTEMLKVNP